MIEALNESPKMPRFIFFILDRDLILQANHYRFGVHIILDKVLPWLLKKIEKAILMRREDLKSKCIGSVGHEPRTFWIKMIQRPMIKNHPFNYYNNTVNLRKKFNMILEDLLARTKNSHIIDTADIFDDYTHFDYQGNLSAEGKKQFWLHVDKQFKKFDRGESDLMPRSQPTLRQAQKKKKSSTSTTSDGEHGNNHQKESYSNYNQDRYQ